jgi:hypothetical protein
VTTVKSSTVVASSVAPSQSLKPVTTTDGVISSTLKPNSVTTVKSSPTATVSAPFFVPSPPVEYKKQVENHCKDLFQDDCASVCKKQFYVESCIIDALAAGSLIFAESSKIQYLSQCRLATNYMKQDSEPKNVKKAEEIQQKASLNENKCSNDCSGNGICGDNGCQCKATFGGRDCSIDLTKLMSYDQEKKQYTENTSPTIFADVDTFEKEIPKSTDPNDNSPKGVISSSATQITISFFSVLLMFL